MTKAIRVLLVEDNSGDAMLIREMLHKHPQFEVHWTERLGTAQLWLQRTPFDVVLLDLGLPDSQGVATLTGLRAAAPKMPVIVLTVLSERETAVQALKSGAQDFLTKGRVDGHLLARAILRHVAGAAAAPPPE
jgi:two-component system, cell cycle response regulator